jgi:DNA-binding transcriptional LysR family regulator
VLPSIRERFAERHPRVEVDVVIGSSRWVADRVAHRDVSLGLAGELEWPDGVLAEPFLEDEIVGIVAPGRLPLRDGMVALDDIASQTMLAREPASPPGPSCATQPVAVEDPMGPACRVAPRARRQALPVGRRCCTVD